jgi:uncharacterized surface protein with fasciclin (FAS1) repeats
MFKTLGLFLAAALFAAAPAPFSSAQARNVIETAEDAGAFSILVRAAKASGLMETLAGPGPYTLFAPTDDAFSKLPRATLESLFKPEGKAKLAEILTYHLVAGTILSRDVIGKRLEAQTLQGEAILIDATSGIKVEAGRVTRADMKADNGVVHVIDIVLTPKK